LQARAACDHLLAAVTDTWNTRRGEVEEASDRIAGELRSMASGFPGGGPPVQPALCDHAVASVLQDEDTERGGFGVAPRHVVERFDRGRAQVGELEQPGPPGPGRGTPPAPPPEAPGFPR